MSSQITSSIHHTTVFCFSFVDDKPDGDFHLVSSKFACVSVFPVVCALATLKGPPVQSYATELSTSARKELFLELSEGRGFCLVLKSYSHRQSGVKLFRVILP